MRGLPVPFSHSTSWYVDGIGEGVASAKVAVSVIDDSIVIVLVAFVSPSDHSTNIYPS